MINQTIERSEADGKGKLIIKIGVLDKSFEVVKLYRLDEETYDEALEQAKDELREMISEGLPNNCNRKVKYFVDDRVREQAKVVCKED